MEGIELTVEDGQPGGESIDVVAPSPAPITEVIGTPIEKNGIDQYSVYGAPVVALALAVLVFIAFRRVRKKVR